MKNLFLTITFIFLFLTSFSQLNMDVLGHLPYSEDLSDVWGYVDENGNEYALVGVYDGFSIVDISDPANPAEVFFGPGPQSIWRDIKTYGDYAYVSNETGGGIYIVDMSPLPGGTITNTLNYTGDIYPVQTIHNLFIDEFGKLYVFGSNSGSGGAIIYDLTQDPMNPVELGRFNDYYLHDGMARGDTLWGAAIYQGVLSAIDVSNPNSPQVMGTVSTPSQFAHNTWVSDDGTHVYTTDEVSSGFIGAFNVTDVTNMYETDRIRSSTGTSVIPHNVHVIDDFLVTAYYTDGIVVHDAKYPDKLIEVANYDTSPAFSGSGYDGSWGAYPFLPSGVILASDIQEGLYILEVDYIRAAFLEGVVTDENSGNPIFNARVEILGAGLVTQTAFDGTYEFGSTLSGTFDVEFSKTGYADKIIEGVEVVNGEITELNIAMGNMFVGLDEGNDPEDNIVLYPNPFSNNISLDIEITEEEGSFSVFIYNSTGTEVESFVLGSGQQKVSFGSTFPSGIYFVRISSGSELIKTERVIKY
jgi:choice-of-anchor B domain-containing protein